LNHSDLRQLFERVSNWGRWGDTDERGTVNLVDAAAIRRGAAEVREGLAIGCGSIDLSSVPVGRSRGEHTMITDGEEFTVGSALTTDSIDVAYHGPRTTHLDALCHVLFDGRMYNDRDGALVTMRGATANAVTAFADGVTTRGVLVDIPALRGQDWLRPNEPVRPDELDAALARQGVDVVPGDALVVYVGRRARRSELGATAEFDGRPIMCGLAPETLDWLRAKDVSLLVSDGGNDVLPAHEGPIAFPIHVGTLVFLGLPLIDNAELQELAQACRERGRFAFQLVVAPLRVEGGTGSPVNPIAVL
jgi:kynurenine formamidase